MARDGRYSTIKHHIPRAGRVTITQIAAGRSTHGVAELNLPHVPHKGELREDRREAVFLLHRDAGETLAAIERPSKGEASNALACCQKIECC